MEQDRLGEVVPARKTLRQLHAQEAEQKAKDEQATEVCVCVCVCVLFYLRACLLSSGPYTWVRGCGGGGFERELLWCALWRTGRRRTCWDPRQVQGARPARQCQLHRQNIAVPVALPPRPCHRPLYYCCTTTSQILENGGKLAEQQRKLLIRFPMIGLVVVLSLFVYVGYGAMAVIGEG